MSKNFHRSNVEEETIPTHDEDDGSSMDVEVRALKAQLKRVKQDMAKLKKENLRWKTMSVVSWMLIVILAHMLFE